VRRVWLIAANVVREQRWFLLLMGIYIAGITTLLAVAERNDEDVLLVFKQEAVYGTFFSVVIAASLFQNERKTRRIIAVLSKGVRRSEYVAGAIAGVNLATVIFYCGVFGSLFLLFPQAQLGSAAVMMLHMLVASLLASVVTVFYTTFLHPLVATVAAGLTLGLPLLLEKFGGAGWTRVLPVVALTKHALEFSVDRPLAVAGGMIGVALLESILLWLVASWIFARRDITTAVE
jgi:ABC-type transport system involved in multi-copper enzyme maturation permease subunit